jgi:phosphatidylglycerol---prolipoprotein diacylglyceryl transferase
MREGGEGKTQRVGKQFYFTIYLINPYVYYTRAGPAQGLVCGALRRSQDATFALDPAGAAAHQSGLMPLFALPFPAINPVLVQLGPLAIRWYALAYIAGLIIGWAILRRVVANDGLWGGAARPSRDSLDDLLAYCAVGVIIGGRLGNVLFYDPEYYFSHPAEIFKLWEGGMAFHGGVIGALAGIVLFARRYKTPALTVMDLVAVVAPIGLFFGRIANFIKPELWGRPTDVAWAIIFPGSDGQPRHPSQIYEALLEGLVLFIVLAILARRGTLRRPGLITGAFAALYGVARIFCEFFRDPDPRLEDLGNGLTMGMLLSTPLVIIGLGLIGWSLQRHGGSNERARG